MKNVKNIWSGLYGIYGNPLTLVTLVVLLIWDPLHLPYMREIFISVVLAISWMLVEFYWKRRLLLQFSSLTSVPFEDVTASYYLSMELYWMQLALSNPSTWSRSTFEAKALNRRSDPPSAKDT